MAYVRPVMIVIHFPDIHNVSQLTDAQGPLTTEKLISESTAERHDVTVCGEIFH